jgi:hypothetical protein
MVRHGGVTEVAFPYLGYEVTVWGDGRVSVDGVAAERSTR